MRARIAGTGKSVPGKVVTNDDLSKIVETNDEWIVARSGIRERRFLEEGRTTSDLAAEAGRRACETAEISPSELDLIVCATISPDMPLPAAAVSVQAKLGASCPAFDIAAACAGFIYGLSTGEAFIRTGMYKKVLVIGVEVLSRYMDMNDRNTCVLFGDGAGAVVLMPSEGDRGILSTHMYADGNLMPLLNIPAGGVLEPASAKSVEGRRHFIRMQGKPVFTHAVKNISKASQVALEHNKVSVDQVDCVVAHQANLRILEGVAERCGIPIEKFYLNIHKYGNTSSASIPIALDEAVREGKIKPGDLLLFAALGAGLSWGSALVRF
jgi:3-oxoacyl-[acyl-carrier-protein] synthase-3